MSFGRIYNTPTPTDLQNTGSGDVVASGTPEPEDSVTGSSPTPNVIEAVLRYLRRLAHVLTPKENAFTISFSQLPVGQVYYMAANQLPNAGSMPFRSIIISLDGNLSSIGLWLGNQAGNVANLPSWLKSYTGESSNQYHLNTTIVGDVTIYNNGSNPVSGTITLLMW